MQTVSSGVICDFGVDISMDQLVIAEAGRDSIECVDNKAPMIKQWLKALPVGSRIAMESTGSYHLQLAREAHEAGMVVYILNGRDVYHYARALGLRGKTDRVDARLIARYCAQEHERLHAYTPPSQRQQAIDALVRRRAGVVEQRIALRAAFAANDEVDLAAVQPAVEKTIDQLDLLIAAIDEELGNLVAADEELKRRCARLQTVSGVGPLAATYLVNLFDRLPFANADALVAYSGLDPRPADSGLVSNAVSTSRFAGALMAST